MYAAFNIVNLFNGMMMWRRRMAMVMVEHSKKIVVMVVIVAELEVVNVLSQVGWI